MNPENLLGNVPNKVNGEYQRPLPRDFETALEGYLAWKDETETFGWQLTPVLPSGIFTDFDTSQSPSDGDIYIGNGDTSTVDSAWGSVTQFSWVRYTADTSSWGEIQPLEGLLCFDTSADSWMHFDGSANGWVELQSKVASTALDTKIIDIGDWDMDATIGISVAHGLSATEWKTARVIDCIIRNDTDGTYSPLSRGTNTGVMDGYVASINSTNVNLSRVTGGNFDNTDYDSTSYNRGWITIKYTKD